VSAIVLLTLLVTGLLSLSAISLRGAAQGQAMAVARANARLALLLAIGQHQRHAAHASYAGIDDASWRDALCMGSLPARTIKADLSICYSEQLGESGGLRHPL